MLMEKVPAVVELDLVEGDDEPQVQCALGNLLSYHGRIHFGIIPLVVKSSK